MNVHVNVMHSKSRGQWNVRETAFTGRDGAVPAIEPSPSVRRSRVVRSVSVRSRPSVTRVLNERASFIFFLCVFQTFSSFKTSKRLFVRVYQDVRRRDSRADEPPRTPAGSVPEAFGFGPGGQRVFPRYGRRRVSA